MSLPEALVRGVRAFRHGVGEPWLQELPALLADCCRRWGLTLAPAFAYPSLSFVAPARRGDGSQAVLKVGFLAEELSSEIAALRLYDGRGAVRLLEAEERHGVLLLERLQPGTALLAVEDDAAATSVAAAVMRRLWRPAPADHAFPTVAKWASGLARLRELHGGSTGPLPAPLVERAERLMADLLTSAPQATLLHGDLQHHNVLRAAREPWLAIDPKGVVGEPAFEVGAWLRNRCEDTADPRRLQARRMDQFAAEAGLDRERVQAWGFGGAVLSAWWSVEDQGSGWESAVRCAELIGAP